MDKLKVDLVNENEMTADQSNAFNRGSMSVDAIPDLEKLTGYILEVLTFLEAPENRNMVENDESRVKVMLNNQYADKMPYGIITLLMDRENRHENVDRLLRMFENMNRAKRGEVSLDDVEKNLSEEVNERYLYSKFGSKEAFEEALKKEIKN